MKTQKFFALLCGLVFSFALSTAALAANQADFRTDKSSPDPVVQTTSGTTHPATGESVKNDKMSHSSADFRKAGDKTDPVVQTTSPEPAPSTGESVENNSITGGK